MSSPVRTAGHLMALLKEKLASLDAGFGIDLVALAAGQVERHDSPQAALGVAPEERRIASPAHLIDRLVNRLGSAHVYRLTPRASHIPERAEMRSPLLYGLVRKDRSAPPWLMRPGLRRPPLLLARPEPITVMAEVPDGPPVRFTWRRVEHRITRAEGPERIAPEWWRTLECHKERPEEKVHEDDALGELVPRPKPRSRDYYRLEAETGAQYWVFRDGLYGSEADDRPPAWFLHGLF
jgi:protein ImuB